MKYESNYLVHYGIPGQKWGIRRFQNEDGTLTEAGKDRYLKNMSEEEQKTYSKLNKSDKKYVEKQMDEGRTFQQAMNARAKNAMISAIPAILSIGFAAYNFNKLAKDPIFRIALKSSFKNVSSSKVMIKGKNILKHIFQRFDKNNVVLNKKNYKIFDPRAIANRG